MIRTCLRRLPLVVAWLAGSGLAHAAITGAVFRDFNADGARAADGGEPGVGAVTITAYATSGGSVSAISAADGTFSLATTAGLNYRLEMTGQPGHFFLGAAGTAGATSDVRFAADGATAVNFGINNPAQYCSSPANADVVNAQLVRNQQTPDGVRTIGSWDYTTSSPDAVGAQSAWAFSETALAGQSGTGSIWGLAYRRLGDVVFSSAFMRRGSPQGDDFDSVGAIYKSIRVGATFTTTLFADLNAAAFNSIDLGVNPHPRSPGFNWTRDTDATWRDVGRVGFGDIDISEDESTLYAINLFQRELLAIPVGTGATVSAPASDATIVRRAVPFPAGCNAVSASVGAPSQADLRPFALTVHDGKVYVGAVCTAQSMLAAGATMANARIAMRAYVFRFDPATNSFEDFDLATPAVIDPYMSGSLDYPRRFVNDGTAFASSGGWLPWVDVVPAVVPTGYGTAGDFYAYPQPMLVDIEIDGFGFMTLGFADRHGYQAFDTDDPGPPGYGGGLFDTRTGGEILLACEQTNGSYVLENNGICTATATGITRTTGDPQTTGAAPNDNTGSGPGSREFYFAERFSYTLTTPGTDSNIGTPDYHREVADGALTQLHGSGSVGAAVYDVGIAFTNGVRFFRTGSVANSASAANLMTRDGGIAEAPLAPNGTAVHEFRATDGGTPRFGKANGMGDIEILCDLPPIQIGNRIWEDVDRNGVQDGGELGIAGVVVRLYRGSDGLLLGQTTTDAGGNYMFLLIQTATTVTGSASTVSISYADLYGQSVVVGLPGTDASGTTTGANGTPLGYTLTLPNVDTGSNREARDSDGTPIDPAGAPTTQAAITVSLPARPGDNRFDADFGLVLFADQGDLPDAGSGSIGYGNYETVRGAGAVAAVSTTLRINGIPDSEFDGQPDAAANGDGADEDGVANSAGTMTLAQGASLNAFAVQGIVNSTGGAAQLCGFIDLNGDGDFSDTSEKATTNVPNGTNGPINLNFGLGSIPATVASTTYARFRLIQGNNAVCPTGTGNDGGANGFGVGLTAMTLGEVEDYRVSITGLNADIQVATTGFACTVGASSDFSITVTSPETYNNGANRTAATINTATLTYVIPATFARVDWAIDPATLDDGEVCLSGCSGSLSSITGSPGTITAVLYLPNDNDGTNPSVAFRLQGIVRSSVATGTAITNVVTVGQPGNLNNDVTGNNTSSQGGTCAEPPPTTNTAICAEPGKDTVSNDAVTTISAVSIVNTYYSTSTGFVGSSIGAGSECLPLDSTSVAASQGAGAPFSAFAAGDLLLVIQMQDADYATDDDLDYGGASTDAGGNGAGFGDLANGGRYEFVQVDGPPGTQDCPVGTLPITGSGNGFGLLNTYFHTPTSTTNREVVQFVKVPQYKGLAFSGAGRIDALPWNGLRGGVAAVDVRDTLNLGASASCKIDASSDGFRGGAVNALTAGAGSATSTRALPSTGAGRKGEGVAGSPDAVSTGAATVTLTAPGYSGGSARKGAPGNAGGGGNSCATGGALGDNNNSHKSGGGGGGNGGPGGKGGSNLRASRLCDTAAASNGGGLGGAPLTNTASLLTLGGGGGSGGVTTATDQNGAGGVGGGVVIVRANAIIGTGDLCTNGGAGQSSTSNLNAGGGGGAGGSLLLFNNISGSSNFSGLRLFASGGSGGAGHGTGNTSQEGGGGGGGGSGRIFVSSNPGQISSQTIAPGAGGVGGQAGNAEDGTQPAALTLLNGANNGLNPYNATPGAKPGFLCSTGTVPVTLSDVESSVEGGTLVVRFGTASEAGTLGFRIHGDIGTAGVRTRLGDLLPARGASLEPQRYEVRGSFNGQTQVWIEELSTEAKSTFYGPYPVGARSGERNLTSSTDWAAIRSEQSGFRRAYAQALLDRGRGAAAEVELRIDQDGWVRVSYEQLLAIGVDWNGIPMARVNLQQAAQSVGIERLGGGDFGPGKAFAFYGQAVRGSLYTRSNVYRLRVAASDGASVQTVFAGVGNLQPRSTARERFEHAPNRLYSFSSPLSDPWFAQRVVRNGTPSAAFSESFVLPTKSAAGSGGERLEVELWGGLDYPESPDHSVRILLNGTEVARSRFDGIARQLVSTLLPAGVLVSGSNNLTLELLGDTGLTTDVVQLEAIRIDYDRALIAQADRLSFDAAAEASSSAPDDAIFLNDFSDEGVAACAATDPACVAYTVSGLSRADLDVLRVRGSSVQRLTGVRRTAESGQHQIQFASGLRPGDRFVVEPPEGGSSAGLAAALADSDPLAGGPARYLIVAHPSFSAGLAPLIAARQAEGFSVRVLNVEDLYRRYSGGVIDPQAIRSALRDAKRRLGTEYVLLVGGDTYDYFNNSAANSLSFIPTVYRPVSSIVRYAPADSAYADVDGDGRADLALGRFPVRSLAELDALVSKTLNYPQAGTGAKLLLLSDREANSVSFRDALAPLAAFLGSSWTTTTLSLEAYPSGAASQARADLVGALASGQSLLTFFGHSAPSSWTREGLVTASLVYGGLFASSSPTAVWQLGCWGAYFVEPRYNTIAHGLLLQAGGGAVAVLGASALTETASDSAWIQLLANPLASQRIGDALRDGQRLLHDQGNELLDISVGGTLLGDPALRLRR